MAQDKDLKTPNVPPLRFPEFSDKWERIPLNQLVDRVTRKNKNEESKIALTISAQYGLVDQESFFNNKVASADLSHYYLLYNGEYAYNKSYSANYPWGATKRLNLYDKGAVSTLYICFRPKDSVDSDFIGHYFESSKWHKGVSEIAVEGARNHGLLNIGVKDYFETTHFIPSLPEQKKIAALLNLIEERIATQNKIIEDLKKLKSAISVQLFEGHNIIGNSNEWKIVSLGDITENFHHRNKNSDSYPMYSVTNTSGFSPQHEVFEGKEIKDEDISIYKIIHKGEFAYNPARINVGSIGRYDEEEPCMISSLYVCFRPTAEVDSDWLLYYLQSAKKIYQYGIFGEGGVRIYLFYPNFSRIEALLPPLKVQKEIASILKSFNRKIKLEELLLSNYQAQKKFLLDQMFT
jgi:type I restriction enzyme S subunit